MTEFQYSESGSDMSASERKEAFKKKARPYLIRFWIVLAISVVFALGFNELAYAFQKEAFDRPAETITINIPRGTAEKVSRGETPPEIPADLTFILGDTLEVVNKDVEPHQLGPLFIPAGTAARLVMENADRLVYTCSFRSNDFLGIEVKQATTFGIRFTGLLLAAPTTAALFYLYSLVLLPVNKTGKKEKTTVAEVLGDDGDREQEPPGE